MGSKINWAKFSKMKIVTILPFYVICNETQVSKIIEHNYYFIWNLC